MGNFSTECHKERSLIWHYGLTKIPSWFIFLRAALVLPVGSTPPNAELCSLIHTQLHGLIPRNIFITECSDPHYSLRPAGFYITLHDYRDVWDTKILQYFCKLLGLGVCFKSVFFSVGSAGEKSLVWVLRFVQCLDLQVTPWSRISPALTLPLESWSLRGVKYWGQM